MLLMLVFSWQAPEVVKGHGYGRQADIWSVGCIVIEMLTGKHPWPEYQNQLSALYAIAKATGGPPLPPNISETCKTFLNTCFASNPAERPSASELLQHPFVARSDATWRTACVGADMNHSL